MISLEKFLACVRENESRINGYEQGHDGSDGKCDCIGLIIGAVRLAGGTWPGTHGSNWAARNAMTTLEHIADAREMFLGEIVYKAREPGEDKYDLPDRYKDSGDLRDYYHVGVVTGVNPLQITHCTSVPGGIAFDTKMGNWRWGGKLKYVDYAEGGIDMEPICRARVHADNDYPVKMRSQPNIDANVLAKIPQGTVVDVMDIVGDWDCIQYENMTGYMMNKFLIPVNDDEADEEKVTVPRYALETWVSTLESLLTEYRDILGRRQS